MYKMDVQVLVKLGTLLYLLSITVCDSTIYSLETSCISNAPCFTLQQFAASTSRYLRNQTILRLNLGYHNFSTRLNVQNTKFFSITSEAAKSIINCNQFSGFYFSKVEVINISNITFIGCGGSNAVINISHSTASITGCMFTHSNGIDILARRSSVIVRNSMFKYSHRGVLNAKTNSSISVTESTFEFNNLTAKYSVLYIKSSKANFLKSTFHNNTAKSDTDIIHVRKGILVLDQCILTNNSAKVGNIVDIDYDSAITIINTHFRYNSLRTGILSAEYSNVTIDNCTFINNTVTKVGVFNVRKCNIEVIGRLEIRENTAEWGVLVIRYSEFKAYQNVTITGNNVTLSTIDIQNSKLELNGSIEFTHNVGNIFIEESKIVLNMPSIFCDNEQTEHKNTSLYEQGGAITCIWSAIYFNNATTFCRNKSWKVGGAINVIESRVYTHSDATYSENEAEMGGALYLDHSYLICKRNCSFIRNKASLKGGAIHAIDSIISIGYEWYDIQEISATPRFLIFEDNYAENAGGGISLEANAKVRGPLKSEYKYWIKFINNTAPNGAAIYVNDYGTCSDVRNSTCFLQTPSFKSKDRKSFVVINSTDSNNAIYGGLLDRCIAKSDYRDVHNGRQLTIGMTYLKKVTNVNSIDRQITSDPVRLCYCHNGTMNCSYQHPTVKAEKGRVFSVSVTAVDQAYHSVNATIQIDYHHSSGVHLGDGQNAQQIPNECSDLTLNIYSSYHNSTTLILYASGPCNSTKISKRSLDVIFTRCTCPIGFQEMIILSGGCQCDCDARIKKYITKCNEATESLIRQGNFWIDYDNTTSNNPYIIYHNCPYDYCLSPTKNVSINLNIHDGADAQCAFHRTGLLCSTCKSPLSLSIGSSRCLKCTEDWPKVFIATIIGGGLSGILFVVIILVLNMTIAVGTLNGFIFYVNIVSSNNIIYRSIGSRSNTPLLVFIAWFNLELGIDTCFFKGLDTYSKIWLQFAFPIYLIVVLFAIITISRCSFKFATLIGKRNPVATLATLILVSYMKFLRNTIEILSFAVLHHPDGSHKLHWLPDANIRYFQGKHIPLFLMAVFIVIIGLSYTVFLFSWQWLLPASNYRLLRWIRNTRFNSFMEVNVAAYRPKQRYWTGLMLLIRVALYLEIAYNYRESKASLLATALIAASLLLLIIVVGGNVYRKKFVGCLNSLFYFNLLMLSIAQFYWQNNTKGKRISAEISVGFAFALLLGVLIYHTIKTLLEISCLNRLKVSIVQRISKMGKTHILVGHQETDLILQIMPSQVAPTFTEVGLSDSREACTNEYGEEHDTSKNAAQLSTTIQEERNSLREPLLLEEQ